VSEAVGSAYDLQYLGALALRATTDNPPYKSNLNLPGVLNIGLAIGAIAGFFSQLKGADPDYKNIIIIKITTESVRILSGLTTTISAVITIVIEFLKKMAQTLVDLSKGLKTAIPVISCVLYTLSALPGIIEVAKNAKEFSKKPIMEQITSIATIVLPALAIIATILVTVCSGVGFIAGVVIGAIATLCITAKDLYSWIQTLKEGKPLDNKGLALNIIAIAVGITSLVLSVVFAPSLIFAVFGAVVCGILIVIPLVNIAYLKVKIPPIKTS